MAGPEFRDRIGLDRREDQSRPVGEDDHPPLAYRYYRRERERLSSCRVRFVDRL